MPPTPPAKPAFNRVGYIATLRATKISEEQGLSILVFLAERCNAERRLRKRLYTAKAIGRAVGIAKIKAMRRLRHLRDSRALGVVFLNRTAHYQLPTETELQRFS